MITQLRLQPIRLPDTECLITPQVSLAEFTSYKVGGPAEWLAIPQTLEQLQECLAWARTQGLPTTTLGAGSNLLISDRGLPGLVISTRNFRQQTFDPETGQIRVGAGRPVPRLAWQAAKFGWSGLEWAVGIPGTVGGAVVMNAGAHGGCTADCLLEAQVLLPDGSLEILQRQQLGYSYRTSALQGDQRLVLQALLQLQPGSDPAQVKARTQTHLDHRLATQPYHLPSCGSVFRNPGPRSAGWLIEQTGLKGYQLGGAQVAERHANFILNCGGATASDIFNLICHIQEQVANRWSLLLKPEVKLLGQFQGTA